MGVWYFEVSNQKPAPPKMGKTVGIYSGIHGIFTGCSSKRCFSRDGPLVPKARLWDLESSDCIGVMKDWRVGARRSGWWRAALPFFCYFVQGYMNINKIQWWYKYIYIYVSTYIMSIYVDTNMNQYIVCDFMCVYLLTDSFFQFFLCFFSFKFLYIFFLFLTMAE